MRHELDANLWERVSGAFHDASALPPHERANFLDRACAGAPEVRREVDAMLAAQDDASALRVEERLLSAVFAPDAVGADALPHGTRVGPYRIDALIGEGGMGEVYRAERIDGEYQQTVALKVVRANVRSGELVRRFHVERQILARLTHPDIVPILDGGATDDGRPYLVMQFVEGTPITDYCERNSLSLDARLGLFRRVADAVQFAHGRLVVHRDIKPSNILVTSDGDPRLLDFGIAKVLTEDEDSPNYDTRSFVRLLTPEHAAPEQLSGEPPTTATDVYALGVLLFQLLTGRRPHVIDRLTLVGVHRAITEQPAPAPSSVVAARADARRLRGDLDRIVLMALRKEPERRYVSAGQFAEDVDRFLAGRPVRAQRDTLSYRTRKLVARNRGLTGLGIGLLVILIASLATASLQARRIARERDLAQRERGTAEAVVRMLTDLFEQSNPYIVPGGDTVRVASLLEDAERRVDALGDQPELQGRMWRTLGNMHAARGRHARAMELMRRSYERQRGLSDRDEAEMARTYHELAKVVSRFEGGVAARPMFDTSLASLRRLLGEDHPDIAAAKIDLASATDDLDEQRRLLDEVTAAKARSPGADSMGIAAALNAQGTERWARSQYAEARALFEASHRILERVLPPDHPNRLATATNLAAVLGALGQWDEAEALSRDGLERRRRIYGSDSAGTAAALEGWAVLQANRGDLASAEQAAREALAGFRRTLAPNHWRISSAMRNVGMLAAARGRVAEGLPLLDSAIAIARSRTGGASAVGVLTGQRSVLLLRLGRTAEASRLADESARMLLAATPEGDLARADAMLRQALTKFASGDAAGSAARFDSAHAMLAGALPATHPRVAQAACGNGVALVSLGRHQEATTRLRLACPIHERWGLAEPLLVSWGRAAVRAAEDRAVLAGRTK